jgi:hypothetical protein
MFTDRPLTASLADLKVEGLDISKTGPMTLEVASGQVEQHTSGQVSILEAAEEHTFVADQTKPTQVHMAVVSNGTDVALWVDAYVEDGYTGQADPPDGYSDILSVAWFTIPPGKTDLADVEINRRVYQ